MSSAIELIVNGYVRLEDRNALEELQRHRERLLGEIKENSGLDHSRTIRQLEDEITVIAAGLAKLG